MRIDYPKLIAESPEELLEHERRLRGCPLESRLKMLRLLRGGHYRSRFQLAGMLGYSSRQLGRWWRTYQEGGLNALLEFDSPGGSQERITEEALDALEERMKAGEIATLEEARTFLDEHFGIHYEGVSGISRLFHRHQSKLKTGRRRSEKASESEQATFKKSDARRDALAASRSPSFRYGRGTLWVEGLAPASVVSKGISSTLGLPR